MHSMDRDNRKETFYSRIGHAFDPSEDFKKSVGKYLALPFEKPSEAPQQTSNPAIASFLKDGLSIAESDASYGKLSDELKGGAPEDVFFCALLSSVRLANAYRAVAVHEGHEQSLNIIVARYANIRSLFQTYSEFPNGVVLPSSDTPGAFVEVRSKLKSCCSALNDNNLAVLVDPDTLKDSVFSFTHVLRFKHPVFRYPRAKVISGVIAKDEDVALFRVLNRSRMEFWYSGECVACWTNADARWHVSRTWDEKALTNTLIKLLGASRSAVQSNRIAKITEIAMGIAAEPNEGGAILFLKCPRFNLGPFEKKDAYHSYKAYPCLEGHIEPMTDCLFDGLSYVDLSQRRMNMDRWGEAVVKRLISMDGGVVLNLSTGLLWSRRKFTGPLKFGGKYKSRGTDHQHLEKRWADDDKDTISENDIMSGKNLEWDNHVKFKEWGTRHQSSLAVTGLCLDKCPKGIAASCKAKSCPRFVVLTMSADGDITLMRNGTVITPEKAEKVGWTK
jgi:hypothetical protein